MPTITYKDLQEARWIDKEGIYLVEIVEVKAEFKNGNDVYVLTMQDSDREQITDRIFFTEKAQWRVEKLLKKCGLLDGVDKEQNVEIDEETFKGCTLKIKAAWRHYKKESGEDKRIMEVRDFYAADEKVGDVSKTEAKPGAVKLGKKAAPADDGLN